MDCARAPSAAAVAEPVRAPAQRADSVVKWAASHSSMQPESCRFNRGLATTLASAFGLAPVSRNHHRMRRNGEFALEERASAGDALQDYGCVGAPETERIRQHNIDFALARRLRHEIDCCFYRRI